MYRSIEYERFYKRITENLFLQSSYCAAYFFFCFLLLGSSFVLQILTPIIGPEPLTGLDYISLFFSVLLLLSLLVTFALLVGSSRMKGGSATLVLLHALVAGSLFASPSSSSAYDFVRKLLKRFEDGLDAVARSANTGLADAIDAAGDTLRAGHRIRYQREKVDSECKSHLVAF